MSASGLLSRLSISRRSVLVLGAATAAMSQTAKPAAAAEADDPASDDVRKVTLGDTEHIRTYYALARS